MIDAWSRHTGGSVKRLPKVDENPYFAVLAKIDNPAVRALVGCVLADNKKLRGENRLAKSNANVVIRKQPVEATQWPKSEQSIQILPALIMLTDSEKAALHHAISDGLLQDNAWTKDEHGRILNGKNGRVIFKIGFLTAIQKLLSER